MNNVSGGWKAGEWGTIDRSDSRFNYEDRATNFETIATNKETGEQWSNDGTGWKKIEGSQWSPYGNNAGQY